MTWDILSPTPPAYSPMARLASDIQERGGGYAYTAPGWAAYKGGVTKASSNAALSALTLLSFLFFLNLLQQQLTSGQQQTLLFMVNNTAPVNREGRKAANTNQPLLAVGSVHAEQDLFGGTVLTVKTLRNSKPERKSRKKRALSGDAFKHSDTGYRSSRPPNHKYENFIVGETSTAKPPPAPKPIPAPPTRDTSPPMMMEGLPSSSTLQLAAWLKGQLSASELRSDLVDTMTNCRAVVACTIYQTSKQKDAGNEQRVKRLLAEAGEYAEPGHLDEACKSLLLSAGDDCSTLAQSFALLLQ